MPKKHISQQRVSSDIPEYLLPPHPSERNSQRPPPSPRTSNPTPATFLLLLALQQMALSLQTMCPFRNSVLPSASSSKVSTAPHDLPPQQIQHVAAQIRIAPLWSIKKRSGGDSHKLRTVGGGGSVSPNIHAMHVKLSSQQLSVPIGSSYGSPYMPPLDLGVSN